MPGKRRFGKILPDEAKTGAPIPKGIKMNFNNKSPKSVLKVKQDIQAAAGRKIGKY